jgi:ATP-dependent Clp protease ATP-binding subunit ClpA
VFERFTERARQVVVHAQDEARALKHNYIGTEHLLLGLLRDEESLAFEALRSLGVSLDGARGRVAEIVGRGDEQTIGQIPFTPRGKKVLELSMREALRLGHNYIVPEHILLGLARENEGVAARILLDFGVSAERVREEVVELVSRSLHESAAEAAGEATSTFDGPRLVSALESITRAKEAAMEAQNFELAASLRDRERSLIERLRSGRSASWEGGWTHVTIGGRQAFAVRVMEQMPVVLGWSLFAVSLGIGILIGWLIWG